MTYSEYNELQALVVKIDTGNYKVKDMVELLRKITLLIAKIKIEDSQE